MTINNDAEYLLRIEQEWIDKDKETVSEFFDDLNEFEDVLPCD